MLGFKFVVQKTFYFITLNTPIIVQLALQIFQYFLPFCNFQI
jgi:hypothetical protein